jgi:uncharacterized membrane protein
MKRYLLALFAVVLAIVFSAFTPKLTTVYLIYDGTGAENDFTNNYSQSTSNPGTDPFTSTTIWWFSVSDADGSVTQSEFDDTYFPAADSNSNNSLSDESETSTLEKKTF